jgi:hypothetical protein
LVGVLADEFAFAADVVLAVLLVAAFVAGAFLAGAAVRLADLVAAFVADTFVAGAFLAAVAPFFVAVALAGAAFLAVEEVVVFLFTDGFLLVVFEGFARVVFAVCFFAAALVDRAAVAARDTDFEVEVDFDVLESARDRDPELRAGPAAALVALDIVGPPHPAAKVAADSTRRRLAESTWPI